MSNNQPSSLDDVGHFLQSDQHNHLDLSGYLLPHHPTSPLSYSTSQQNLAAYMQDVLAHQANFPISAPSPFAQYWDDNQATPFSNPFPETAALAAHDIRPSIQVPSPIHPGSPPLAYHSSLPWGESNAPNLQLLNGTPERASAASNQFFHNNFRNVYAPPQAVTFHNYPISNPSDPRPPTSNGRPWEMGAMAGSLDVTTGVYQRAPEHPRVRTAQACEKCRIRKAKCTGDRPCQRCRTRGLTCEYAPERKMRGPNKMRRKGTVEAASARRASVTSSSSSSDDQTSSRARSPRKLFALSSEVKVRNLPPAVLNTVGASSDRRSPVRSDGSSDSDSPRPRRTRPPRLDLSHTGVYDVEGQLAHAPDTGVEADARRERSPATAARRASLPPYLLESYTRVALASRSSPASSPAEVTPRPVDFDELYGKHLHSLPNGQASQGLSSYSHSRSSSGTSMSSSTPLTPPHMPSDNMLPSGLAYPQDIHASEDQFMSDFLSSSAFASFEPQYISDDLHDPISKWTTLGHVDNTPTVGPSMQEKSFSQGGNQTL